MASRATFISCLHCDNPNDCVTFYGPHFAIFNAWVQAVLADLVLLVLPKTIGTKTGHVTLMPEKFYPFPNLPQLDLGRRADSRWALPQISSWFCKTLIAIYWTTGVNLTCIKLICSHTKKTNNSMLFVLDKFSGSATKFHAYKWRRHSDVIIKKSHRWWPKLNSLQNVYIWFFIFRKPTEWCCFVTYLWNDPCNHAYGLIVF